jgi:hypothetical protein
MSPARLIFVDETGAATNMARRYGRSPRGLRLDGPVLPRPTVLRDTALQVGTARR